MNDNKFFGFINSAENFLQQADIIFSFLSIYFISNTVSMLCFGQGVINFFIDKHYLNNVDVYIIFVFLFFVAMFVFKFVSVIFRKFLCNLGRLLDDFRIRKEKPVTRFLLSYFETEARKNNNYVLYEIIKERRIKSEKHTKQLDMNFLLGFSCFVNFILSKVFNIGLFYTFVRESEIYSNNKYFRIFFISMYIVCWVIIIIRCLSSFLFYSEYYIDTMECPKEEVEQKKKRS